jgi:hypothetical protein
VSAVKRFFGVLLLTTVIGCTSVTHIHLTNRLRNGIGKEEVVSTMGSEPAEKMAFGGKEVLVYYLHASVFDLIFNQKRLPYVGFYPLLQTGREYWIVLERDRDRVVAFGYAENFGNSLRDPERP